MIDTTRFVSSVGTVKPEPGSGPQSVQPATSTEGYLLLLLNLVRLLELFMMLQKIFVRDPLTADAADAYLGVRSMASRCMVRELRIPSMKW
jgi:hypothetical protein